ncbi:MAG: topoisomerase DNA-binding C4 zinc finger domain-containing protein, partial [candidate division KSB1 bacterium]|nr:topoisomerase DNA-binding C4 zinc finger domain-containing protein [candidate division KSB1 bacterium]
FTKPPARYSESSLVKELDNLGIGRPSTYAVIISTILARKYVEREGRQLRPTELGRMVNKILIRNFPDIFNVKFTALMEEQLDRIESGERKFLNVVEDFYVPFSESLRTMDSRKEAIKESLLDSTTEKCPECGKDLIIRWGRNGKFIACTGYPECRYTKLADVADNGMNEATCDKCGRPMVLKVGRYGKFMACSGYPECKNARPYSIGIKCPKEGCPGNVVERKSKRGKLFYGCSQYPNCDFVSWYKPVERPCPDCGSNYLEQRYTQAKGEYLRCPRCEAEFEPELENAAI